MNEISLCAVTYNNEELMSRMIDSCRDLVDEIVIVDQSTLQESMDYFKDLATFYIHTTCKGYADPDRQYALDLASKDWILMLDADEMLSQELQDWLILFKEGKVEENVDIYWFVFQNLVRNNGNVYDIKQILGDDPHPRLFKRGSLQWPPTAHTFPNFLSNKVCVSQKKVIHDRTWGAVKKTHEDRMKVITPDMQQMEANFLRNLEMIVGSGTKGEEN